MKTNLFSRFRNLFRKAEPDYEYEYDEYDEYEEGNESYSEDYSDVVEPDLNDEDSSGVEKDLASGLSGRALRLPHGADVPETESREAEPQCEPQGNGVHVPLAPIIAGMPLELQSRVLHEVGDLSVFLPLETILPQLSKGIVLLSFGELRKAAPKVFHSDRDQDGAMINVPLSAVLPQISPDMLVRKGGSAQMEIPDEIVSPFADKGKGLAIGAVKPVHGRPAAPSVPASAPKVSAVPPKAIPVPAHKTPAPQPAPVAARMVQPVQRPLSSTSQPPAPQPNVEVQPTHGHAGIGAAKLGFPSPSVLAPSASARASGSGPVQPVSPAQSTGVTGNGTQIVGKRLSDQAPMTPSQGVPAALKPKPQPLQVSLSAVADAWPDSLKQEIIQLQLAEATLTLPYEVVEGGLKRGRLCFPWKQLRAWIQSGAAASVSVHDGTELELPLRVVAPLFIARKNERPEKTVKVAIDKDIPNLFFGLPQPDTTGVALDHSVNRPLDTNYYVWDDQHDTVPDDARNDIAAKARSAGTEFVTRYATPNEVVSRAAALEGVEGAVIALPDGLMVASQLPPGLNGDTLAAFLPHLFGKVTQCTQELRMGQLNNLNFTVGNVPWKIWRVNALYFAAFGREAEPLPTARLSALAGELDHKSKA